MPSRITSILLPIRRLTENKTQWALIENTKNNPAGIPRGKDRARFSSRKLNNHKTVMMDRYDIATGNSVTNMRRTPA